MFYAGRAARLGGTGIWMDERQTGRLEAADAVLAVLRRRALLLRYCVRRVGSWDEAEDLVAELAGRAVREGLPADPEACRRRLLDQAALLCRRWRRQRDRARRHLGGPLSLDERVATEETEVIELVDTVADPGPAAVEQAEAAELWRAVEQALGRLRPAERRLLERLAAGEPLTAVARASKVSRHRLTRRARRLREELLNSLPPDLAAALRARLGWPAAPSEAP